jgi:hypothetical protein
MAYKIECTSILQVMKSSGSQYISVNLKVSLDQLISATQTRGCEDIGRHMMTRMLNAGMKLEFIEIDDWHRLAMNALDTQRVLKVLKDRIFGSPQLCLMFTEHQTQESATLRWTQRVGSFVSSLLRYLRRATATDKTTVLKDLVHDDSVREQLIQSRWFFTHNRDGS